MCSQTSGPHILYLSTLRMSDMPQRPVLNTHHRSDLVLMSSASAAQAMCSQG